MIDSGAGADRIATGDGADSVVFGTGYGLNLVNDDEDGIDRILIEGGSSESPMLLSDRQVDAEIGLAAGSRLVLRDVDIAEIGPDDCLFETPEIYCGARPDQHQPLICGGAAARHLQCE